jgi:hypothetical protein
MEGHQKQHHRYHPQPVNIPPALRQSRFVDSLSVQGFLLCVFMLPFRLSPVIVVHFLSRVTG